MIVGSCRQQGFPPRLEQNAVAGLIRQVREPRTVGFYTCWVLLARNPGDRNAGDACEHASLAWANVPICRSPSYQNVDQILEFTENRAFGRATASQILSK